MRRRSFQPIMLVMLIVSSIASGCTNLGPTAATTASATPSPTPSKSFTAADIAKLKWIEGTWRGMDGDKPFFERYRLDGAALVVDGFTDGSLKQIESTGRFELKDGEFGKTEGDRRSVATFITNDAIQFGPGVPGKGNYFRFERKNNGTWHAVLEWPAVGEKPARSKVYVMEPYKAP